MSPTSYQTAPPRIRDDSGVPGASQPSSPDSTDGRNDGSIWAVPPSLSIEPDSINATIAELWPGRPHELVELSATHAVGRMTVDQSTLRPGGYVPGPVQFGLADVVLWYLSFGVLDRLEPMALTSELSIRFLRPGQGTILWARADLERAGRSSMVGTVRVWMDAAADRPVSTAQGTYTLPRNS